MSQVQILSPRPSVPAPCSSAAGTEALNSCSRRRQHTEQAVGAAATKNVLDFNIEIRADGRDWIQRSPLRLLVRGL